MSMDLYVHARIEGAPDAPVLLSFHGTGGDETQFTHVLGQILPEATQIAPRGDVSEMGAARFFRRTGEGVYDMNDLAQRTDKMQKFVSAIREEYPGRPVIGLGYSNGANILASVLFADPSLFDRAVLMHPLIPFEPPAQSGLAGTDLLITAGTRDPICPLPLTEQLVGYFEDQGAQVTRHTHSGGHEIQNAELHAVAEFLQSAP